MIGPVRSGVAGGAAIGAGHMSGAFTEYEYTPGEDVFASDLIGARIYATENEVGDSVAEGGETEWDDLGEINDLILNRDGASRFLLPGKGSVMEIDLGEVTWSGDRFAADFDGGYGPTTVDGRVSDDGREVEARVVIKTTVKNPLIRLWNRGIDFRGTLR